MARPLTTAEVAHRLGVKPETVYAYVSRGRLARHPASTRRGSLFDPDEVERLAGQARHGDRSGALEVVIETELTRLDPAGRLAFRGRDAVELARHRRFEDVAALLWDGEPYAPWTPSTADRELLARVRDAPDGEWAAVDRIPLAVAALGGGADPARGDRSPDAVRRAGARILGGVLEILAPGAEGFAATRLWAAIAGGDRAPRPTELGALNAALVLLADHELAASTLAARVAASAWADPYRVVLAGLGPIGGALHGAAGTAAEALLAEAATAGPFAAVDARIAAAAQGAGLGVPGFGHRVYRDADPRAEHLLARLDGLAVDRTRARTVQGVVRAAAQSGLPPPNVDFALAALVHVSELAPGASATVFAVARIVGLLAHALEEYPHRIRFRPRATYVGPLP